MKAAIIGLGVIGKVHYNILKKEGVEVVAICDTDDGVLEKIDEVRKYTDYKTMLDNEDIDVVHICTPHYLHADMTIYALERNVNVLCEKPLCIRKEDIARIMTRKINPRRCSAYACKTDITNPVNLSKDIFKTKKSILPLATCCGIATRRIMRRENGGAKKKPKAAECLSIRQYIRLT